MTNTFFTTGTFKRLPFSLLLVLLLLLTLVPDHVVSLSEQPPHYSRRNVLEKTASAVTSGIVAGGTLSSPQNVFAQDAAQPSIDMNAINALRTPTTTVAKIPPSIVPLQDPPPLLSLARSGIDGKSANIKIPRIGYSFYKTSTEQASRCTALALRCGIRHFDVATLYGSNAQVGSTLQTYLNKGLSGLDYSLEKPEVLDYLDSTAQIGYQHASSSRTISSSINSGVDTTKSKFAPPPEGSAGRRGRRDSLFISHKLSNAEQSTDKVSIRRAVKSAIATLGVGYLDLVSIHSPLTTPSKRLTTYETLLELRDSGFVKSVGVCNYGIGPLQEIENAGLDVPSINQLELSPFNTHAKVLDWCNKRTIVVGCGAWSKLSSATGPQDGWAKVAELAKAKGVTKAQILVRWSLQKGYVCVPRSASTSKIERLAIGENSYGGVNANGSSSSSSFMLTDEEMNIIDGLNVNFKAGQLGRRDGWDDEDVTGPEWDPTDFV